MFGLRTLNRIFSDSVVPADVFSLVNWNIDIPENNDGELFYDPASDVDRSDARAIRPVGSYTGRYFFAVRRPDGTPEVHMIAPVFGSTSSPGTGSDGTRCEFRGIIQGGGAQATYFRKANVLTMSATVRIIQLPNQTQEVDLCQIQPQIFLILVRRNDGRVESRINLFNGSGIQNPRLYIASGMGVGDTLSFSVTYGPDDALHWRNVRVNGGAPADFDQPVEAAYGTLTNMYPKAGAYHAVDPPDSLDAPAAVNGLLAHALVTDRAWLAYSDLSISLGVP